MRLSLKNSRLLIGFGISLFWVVFLSSTVYAEDESYHPYPQPDSGYVSDHANLLTWDNEERIEKWLWQVESRSKIEIIVVVIDSIDDYSGTANDSIESFAEGMFNTYGIGNMPKNDGILFLVAKSDRKARIELGNDYGSHRDADALKIMDNVIIPEFREGDYVKGITNGTEAIIKEFANMRIGFPWYIVGIVIAAIACLIIGVSLVKSGKKGWGYVLIGFGLLLILLAVFLAINIIRHMPRSNSSSWSSGGMGGFGGGSSGGGGATGGW